MLTVCLCYLLLIVELAFLRVSFTGFIACLKVIQVRCKGASLPGLDIQYVYLPKKKILGYDDAGIACKR